MTILAVGGEVECFEFVAGQAFAFEATSGRYIATASRYAMKVQQAVSEITLALPSNQTEIWMHAYLYQEAVGASDYIFFKTLAGGNAYKIALESDGRWSLYKYASSSWGSALATSAAPVIVSAGAQIDIHIKRHASGTFDVFKNGASVVTYSGDTTGDASNFGLIHFYGQTSSSNDMNVSQVIVTDTVDTRGWVLCTLQPTGSGSTSAWAGAYTDIDDTTYDESDYIHTKVTNDVSTFAAADINAGYAGATVKAVAVAMRAYIDIAAVPHHVEAALRASGTNYFSADLSPTNNATPTSAQKIWETDPSTSSAWASVSAVNALEVGVKATA